MRGTWSRRNSLEKIPAHVIRASACDECEDPSSKTSLEVICRQESSAIPDMWLQYMYIVTDCRVGRWYLVTFIYKRLEFVVVANFVLSSEFS